MSSEPKAVGYGRIDSLDELKANKAAGVTVGTYSETVGRTIPLYDEQTLSALRAEVEALRAALELIASQGPNYGPDGTRDSWLHWSEIARMALADNQGCLSCGPSGVFATDGTGPYDCYACGKKAAMEQCA